MPAGAPSTSRPAAASPCFSGRRTAHSTCMGTFIYGQNCLEVEIDDHTLVHLRAVITSKLRKHESFPFTIPDGSDNEVTVWIDCSIPVAFRVGEEEADRRLNSMWLLQLSESTNRPS